jgi:GTPase involved in cell partitioning and DNA repair
MDMPALSSHSHQDRGMGNAFLKHLYRVRIIIIAIDAAEEKDAVVQLLKEQISFFEEDVSGGKKFFYLRTKADTIKESSGPEWLAVSAKTGKNIETLKKKIIEELGEK